MNRCTDRFETVLPDSLRRRYRVPRGTNTQPQCPIQIKYGIRKPLSIIDLGFAGVIVICLLCAIPIMISVWNWNHPSPEELNAKRKAEIIAPVFSSTPKPLIQETVDLSKPTPFPTPILESTPDFRSMLPQAAQTKPVPTPIHESGFAQMPYGETLWISILGNLPNQESLPRTGNHIGDAYRIGKDVFAWVAPNGIGQWIDPQ